MLTARRFILSRALPALLVAAALAVTPMATPLTGKATAEASTPDEARTFINDLAERAVADLNEEGVSDQERRDRFRVLLDDGFEVDTIARFVLGRYWRAAEESEREDFIETFTRMAEQRFLPVFAEFDSEDFEVTGARADSNADGVFLVSTRIQLPGTSERPEVQWRVRERDGQFRIIDVVAEGVSMAITLRSEYGSVIQREGGVAGLTAMLNERIDRGEFEADSAEELVQ